MDRATHQLDAPAHTFTQLLYATPRGARLGRLLAVTELRSWDVPSGLVERAELVVAELVANAVLHGSPPGRCVRLTLVHEPLIGRLRVDVTDARGEFSAIYPAIEPDPDVLRTSGRGLALVAALADHWETIPHPHGGKTVRAVLSTASARA